MCTAMDVAGSVAVFRLGIWVRTKPRRQEEGQKMAIIKMLLPASGPWPLDCGLWAMPSLDPKSPILCRQRATATKIAQAYTLF